MDLPAITDALHEQGWVVCPGFLDAGHTAVLREHVRGLQAAGALRPARIGHGQERQRNDTIRGDAIAWLEEGEPTPVRDVEQRFDSLRRELNRELMLGLFEFEGHFASYAPGTGYRRHLDQFHDSDTRRLSCVLYLNEADWGTEDGGALRLFLDGEAETPFIDIPPCGGTLVLFLSARFYHEVRITRRERLSLTGWFRVRE